MPGNATSVGQIGLDLVLNSNAFRKQVGGIENLAKKAGAAIAGAFAVKKILDFGASCIQLGSDLSEVQNVVDVTFPRMSSRVDEFARSAAQSFGLSETMAKRYIGTFGSMAEAFGFTEGQAYEMSTALTGLAGDVASFYNIDQDAAYTKLKSVFTGETESLKELGVVMTQTALDSFALANGFGKTTASMTEAEKVALRYAFVQKQLTNAAGDFSRTAGGWANQVRILKLQFESLKASIGQGLINVLTPVLRVINSLLGRLTTLANAFKAFTELLTGNKSSGSSSLTAAMDDLSVSSGGAADAVGNVGDAASGAGDAAKAAAREMRALMGFDAINKVADNSSSGSGGGSGGSGGSGGGGGGGGGALGEAVDYGSIAEGETVLEKYSEALEKLMEVCQPTIDALKRLWNEGLSALGQFAWDSLKDFWEHFLKPVGLWTMGEGLPRFIDALNNGLMNIDYEKIRNALTRLWDALAPFTIHVGEGLLWFWENVLVPLGTWTASEVVPRFLNTLAAAIEIVNAVIEALKPLFSWFWENVLQPIAEWTGGVFLAVWDGINSALDSFAAWCRDNPGAIEAAAAIVGAFFAVWTAQGLAASIAGIIGALANFGTTVTAVVGSIGSVAGALSIPINLLGGPFVVALAGAIAVGVLLWKNWDTIKETAGKVWGWISDWVGEKIGGIVDFFSGLVSKGGEVLGNLKSIKDSLGGFVSKKVDVAVSLAKKGWSTIESFVGTAVSTVVSLAKKGWSTISGFVGTAVSVGASLFKSGWSTISSFVGTAVSVAAKLTKNGWSTISGFVGTAVSVATSLKKRGWKSLSSWIGSSVSVAVKLTKGWLGSGISAIKKLIGLSTGGIRVGGKWKPIRGYADGGNPESANLFFAHENGMPELVGRIGSNTAVLNNDQIVASVANGVAQAVAGVLNHIRIPALKNAGTPQTGGSTSEEILKELQILRMEQNSQIVEVLREILAYIRNLELTADVDVNALKKLIVKLINDKTRATGICEIEV